MDVRGEEVGAFDGSAVYYLERRRQSPSVAPGKEGMHLQLNLGRRWEAREDAEDCVLKL